MRDEVVQMLESKLLWRGFIGFRALWLQGFASLGL